MITVSCIVACYNAAGTLRAAVESALRQTGVEVEVIVVDDCSRDDSLAVANAMARDDRRVRVIAHTAQSGPSAARNSALAIATGDWMAILDADDFFAPERLSALSRFACSEGLGIVFDNQRIISDTADASDEGGRAFDFDDRLPVDMATFFKLSRTRRGGLSIGYAKPLYDLDMIRRHRLTYDERFRVGEDWKFFLRALASGARGAYTDQPLYVYRRSDTSITLGGRNNYFPLADMVGSCISEMSDVLDSDSRRELRRLRGFFLSQGAHFAIRQRLSRLKAAVRNR